MILTRRMSHYMITYYLPCSLFVVVSWTSFLIPSEDIQGRMALLVTLFLVLVSYELWYANYDLPVFLFITFITYSENYILNISRWTFSTPRLQTHRKLMDWTQCSLGWFAVYFLYLGHCLNMPLYYYRFVILCCCTLNTKYY